MEQTCGLPLIEVPDVLANGATPTWHAYFLAFSKDSFFYFLYKFLFICQNLCTTFLGTVSYHCFSVCQISFIFSYMFDMPFPLR